MVAANFYLLLQRRIASTCVYHGEEVEIAMRTALMLLILTGITLAADKRQVEWVVSLEKAFRQARDK